MVGSRSGHLQTKTTLASGLIQKQLATLDGMSEPNSAPESEQPVKKSRAAGTWGVYPKSISRIETPKNRAWYVRIFYAGAYERKTFSDAVWGTKDNALQEALRWRDETEARMGKPRTDRSVRKKVLGDDNDLVGIYRRHAKHMKRGKTYFRDIYEIVWAVAPGKLSRRTISITKHGEDEALRRAKALRAEKEREHFGARVY